MYSINSSVYHIYPQSNKATEPIYTKMVNIFSTFLQNNKINSYQQKIDDIASRKINIYENYKNNPEYQKLSETQYFNGNSGRNKLVGLITDLEIEKADAKISDVKYGNVLSHGWIHEKKGDTDITKCLKNINKVLSNKKFTATFKQFVLSKANDLTFHVMRLDNIENAQITQSNVLQIESNIMTPIFFL